MIEATGISVVFGAGTVAERRALLDLSLAIRPGEFVTVIGSNGAGKSTLLNALSGDVPVSAGQIRFGDIDVTHWPVHRRAPHVGRVFQDPLVGTCGALSIEDNLALAANRARPRGLALAAKRALRERLRERLATLGLGIEKRLGDRMDQLSGGQRQTVSLVMASLVGMKVLLLDEHTAALDPEMAKFVLRLTDRIVSENALTALMVTHSMRQALDHGTRTIMLHQGRIVVDIAGEERRRLSVDDLLAKFGALRADALDDDALLLT